MKEFIDKIVEKLIKKPELEKPLDIRNELSKKVIRSRKVRDMIKMEGWQEIVKEQVQKSLESGMSEILREGNQMPEANFRAIVADMKAHLGLIANLEYIIDEGDRAIEKLKHLEKRDK